MLADFWEDIPTWVIVLAVVLFLAAGVALTFVFNIVKPMIFWGFIGTLVLGAVIGLVRTAMGGGGY